MTNSRMEEERQKARQEDEFEVLQSIYSGDIIDLRKNDAWQMKRSPEMLISLRPVQSSAVTEAHARIDLRVKCPSAYPDIIPEIVLKNPKGLSDQKIKILLEELHDLALTRIGVEMIHELCNHVESFLHDNNRPPRCSFYDEMIYEQNRAKEEKAKEDEKRQELQRKLEEDELNELEEQLKRKEQERREDAKRYREMARQLNIDHQSVGETNEVLSEQSRPSLHLQISVSPGSREMNDQCCDTLRISCTEDLVSEDASQLLNHSFTQEPSCRELSTSGGCLFSHSYGIKKYQASKITEGGDTDDAVDSLLLQSISSESRLKREFRILQMIGSGGFGDVLKVRNILDNRCYAIKRISLNPALHRQFKKLTREVEVLSKLNHENIVRYFNSWLETCEDTSTSDGASSRHVTDNETESDDDEISKTPSELNIKSVDPKKNLSNSDSQFALVNNRTTELWSEMADELDDKEDSSDSSEFSDSYLDVFDQSHWMMSSSYEENFIVFEKASEDTALEKSCESEEKARKQSKNKGSKHNAKKQYLYIQMEYCEKRTLRDCIDRKNLYKDVNRVWELFREILEGLAHIHDQGIIHRDLKPVNIFLDSEYHVKIGDFGLATAYLDIIAEPSGTVDVPSNKKPTSAQNDDTSLTGRVGTTLYVSPEMESNNKRYNLKVDIYSLGIIFFEMCYRPMATQMERMQILSNIRKELIEFPDDFHEICLPDQARIIRLLLNHDPFKRPTAKELLKSEYIPLSQIEESQIYDVLDMTISNTEGRTYKHMLHKIFVQPVQTVTDFLYDTSLFKTSFTTYQALVQQTVASNLELIFKRHGAFRIPVPLLMPSSALYNCDTYVTMMDRSGGLVSLPYDMMVPFARFVARAKVLSSFRRYSIDRVFRECRPSGVHPRQLWAASFDIVCNSAGSLLDDVEVIYVVYEIIKQFPALNSGGYQLRLNHASLVKAILLHCGVPDEFLLRVCTILGDSSIDRQIQRQKLLNIESLSESCVDKISFFLQKEDIFEKMSSFLRCISKTKSQAASLVKKGLFEIENIIAHLSILGCTLEPIVSLLLVSNIHFFSGILFQVMHEGKRKKKMMLGVLAAGGRYDNLIAMFRKPTERQLGCPQAVGFSIAFDKIVSAAVEHGSIVPEPLTELLICAIRQPVKKDLLLKAARRFWEMGVSASIYQDSSHSMDEIKVHCRHNFIPYILTSTIRDADQTEWTLIKIQLEKERILKKEKNLDCLVEFFQKLHLAKVEIPEINRLQASSIIQLPTDAGSAGSVGIGGGSGAAVLPSWNVTFALPEGKETNRLYKNTRRAYEAQIDNGIRETLARLNIKNSVEVIATELPSNILKAFAAHFEPNKDEASIMTSIGIKDGQKSSCKKYITRLIGEIKELRSKHKMLTVILYSLADDIHRVLSW